MPYREVRVVDCLEVLRHWLAGDEIRCILRSTGLHRKTTRRVVEIAQSIGIALGIPWPEENLRRLRGMILDCYPKTIH